MTTDNGTGRLRHAGAKVNKTKVNMCVCGRMPVSMVQSWRLKKEGVVPGEGEGETLTVGNAQKM